MSDQIVRRLNAIPMFGTGPTKFDADIAPRLAKIKLGPHSVGFTRSSIDKLIKQMVAESKPADRKRRREP